AQRLASEFGADQAAASQRLAQAVAQREQLLGALTAATEAQAAELRRLLGDLGSAGGPAAAALLGDQILADHWWVQVMSEGQWVDLDPTLPTAVPGQTLSANTTATGRFGPTTLGQLAAVEGACRDLTCGDRLHTVLLRAI